MAKTYANPRQRAGVTAEAAGALYLDVQQLDVADPALGLGTLAVNDAVQIGVVPAGHVLVTALSQISIPKLDTNGTATGKVSIGTADDADALVAATSVGAAVSEGVGDLTGDPIVAKDVDVTILLTCTAACATQATSGTVVSRLVLRAYNQQIDG